jgi:hypothetical protein
VTEKIEPYPHPDRLLREINEVLTDGIDAERVEVPQGILRRCCWHLYRFKAISKELASREAPVEAPDIEPVHLSFNQLREALETMPAGPPVIHARDATYPIVDVHVMHDGKVGIEIAMHETGDACNCERSA